MVERVGRADPVLHRHEHAFAAARNLAAVRAVFLEEMASDAVAFGDVDEIGFEADQPARRDDGLDEHVVGMVLHVDDLRFAAGEGLKDVAEILAGTST